MFPCFQKKSLIFTPILIPDYVAIHIPVLILNLIPISIPVLILKLIPIFIPVLILNLIPISIPVRFPRFSELCYSLNVDSCLATTMCGKYSRLASTSVSRCVFQVGVVQE